MPSECCSRDYSQAVTLNDAPCGSLVSRPAVAAALLLLSNASGTEHPAGNQHLVFSSPHTSAKSRKSVMGDSLATFTRLSVLPNTRVQAADDNWGICLSHAKHMLGY